MKHKMKTFGVMLRTELMLSFRGMDMLIFAICMPLVILVIIGVIFGDKPAFEGATYSFFEQSFGAIASIAICAGGVMGLPLVISDYRSKKILKRFRVTPVSPLMLLSVQITIYSLYAFSSLLLVYVFSRIFFNYHMEGSWFLFLCGFFLVMISIFSIGIMVGGIAPNMKTAGIIASILYFPMLIFSGATLPYEIMPDALQHFADFMPLTQGIIMMKSFSLGLPVDGVMLPIITMVLLGILCAGVSLKFFRWE